MFRDISSIQGTEAEASTTRLKCRDDFINIIGDDTKSGCAGILLNNTTKGELSCSRHGIGFIKDDQLRA